MKEDYGNNIFEMGCPVCKEVCCCSNKTLNCERKNHCYRKCPASKKLGGSCATETIITAGDMSLKKRSNEVYEVVNVGNQKFRKLSSQENIIPISSSSIQFENKLMAPIVIQPSQIIPQQMALTASSALPFTDISLPSCVPETDQSGYVSIPIAEYMELYRMRLEATTLVTANNSASFASSSLQQNQMNT